MRKLCCPGIVLAAFLVSMPASAELGQKNEIVCAVTSVEVNPADAGIVPTLGSFYLQSLQYGWLVRPGTQKNELLPDLADRWTTSPDGLIWTFYLRKGVKFHDGTEITAADVEAVYAKIQDPKEGSPLRHLYRLVESIKAKDKGTVEIKLRAPYGSLPYLLMRGITPARAVAQGSFPLGTGPFKVVSTTPDTITFAANKDYFEGQPKLDRITFRSYPDQKRAWVALMQGEVEAVTDLEQEDYDVIKHDSRFRTYEVSDLFCYSLMLNTKDPVLAIPELRRSISLAIDRKDLIDRALRGAAVPATGPFLPDSWAADPDPDLQTFDLARARLMLGKLGWRDIDKDWVVEKDGRPLSFTILLDRGDTLKEAIATRLQWQLLQAGIRTDVEYLPLEELFVERLLPGKFQAVIMQTNAFGDPDQPMTAFWHSSSIDTSNLCRYANPTLDRMIEQARAIADQKSRQDLYRRMHRLLAEEAPAAFLFVKKLYSATSARITGVSPTSGSFYDTSMKDWYISDASKGGR